MDIEGLHGLIQVCVGLHVTVYILLCTGSKEIKCNDPKDLSIWTDRSRIVQTQITLLLDP